MKRLSAIAASFALIASPIAHAAADRAQAPLESGASEMGGRLPLPALIVLLAILAGGIFIAIDDGNSSPDSP